MNRILPRITAQIVNVGVIVSALFLLSTVGIFVAGIVWRIFGSVIGGTYEIVELFAGGIVTFSLAHSAFVGNHVTVKLLLVRFRTSVQKILKVVTLFIHLGFWAVVFFASFQVLMEKRLNEDTLLLKIPILPFRALWCLGVLFFCLVLIRDLMTIKGGKE